MQRQKTDGSAKVFTLTEVQNRIDTTRKKYRDAYKFHHLPTTTETSLGATLTHIDTQAAIASWQTFKVYHRLFFQHPQWDPGDCINRLDVRPAKERPPVHTSIYDLARDIINVQLTPSENALIMIWVKSCSPQNPSKPGTN